MDKQEVAQELLRRKKARNNLIDFMEYVWWRAEPFQRANHIVSICKDIDDAIIKFEKGESSCLDIACCFGHGKSFISSIALPAYFLGRCFQKDPNIIMTGYSAGLINGFSKSVKTIMNSKEYQILFPQVRIKRGDDSVQEWGLENSEGHVTAVGLGGSITGKRANLIIIDDYCKNASEARSETYRDRIWRSFSTDLMSRLHGTFIVLVVATPWTPDGLQGRIVQEENKNPNFPKFKHIKYPAKIIEDGKWQGKYLWEQHYPKTWYENQYALNQSFAHGLLDCEPVQQGGNRFKIDMVKLHDNIKDFPEGRYVRCWDLASSSAERNKNSPDFTVGMLGLVTKGAINEDHLWLKQAIFGQWEAPLRNQRIEQVADSDGRGVPIFIEDFGAYKDAYTEMKFILKGKNLVQGLRLPGDKSTKLAPLEPIFEAGNVHIIRNNVWYNEFYKQFAGFPNGEHDDFPDATALVYHACTRSKSGVVFY